MTQHSVKVPAPGDGSVEVPRADERMNDEDESLGFSVDAGDSEDVEILEVVGLDEDEAPASATEALGDPEQAEEGRDLVFSLDDDGRDDTVDSGTDAADAQGATPEERNDDNPPVQGAAAGSLVDQELIQRLRADYDNLRKRVERERREFEVHANASLIGRLLPILDNFERALSVDLQPGADSAFREGLFMIYKHLNRSLEQEGLRVIEAVGSKFDPVLHDAVATEVDTEAEHNVVVEELQRGYLFQNRVLRPAMVKVRVNSGAQAADRGDADG